MKWEKKRKRRERKKKILGKILWAFVSHQCCLLDSFHCSRPDNKNAVRAKTPCARLAGTLRRPPGHQSGCQGRGTGMKPGPEAPSPAHPAGMAPHDALEAECRWRKCHWSCCNICTVTARDGKKSETHSFIWCPFVAECSPTDNSQRCFTYRSGSSSFHISVERVFSTRHRKPLLILLAVHKTMAARTQLEHSQHSCKKCFQQLNQRLKVQSNCL